MGFLNKVSEKASVAYKCTTETAGKIAKEAKLKYIINENKSKIEDQYEEIGKKVYQVHIREEEIDLEEYIKEEIGKIDALAQEIKDVENELLELKELKKCLKCGAKVDKNDNYCAKCGNKMNNEEE